MIEIMARDDSRLLQPGFRVHMVRVNRPSLFGTKENYRHWTLVVGKAEIIKPRYAGIPHFTITGFRCRVNFRGSRDSVIPQPVEGFNTGPHGFSSRPVDRQAHKNKFLFLIINSKGYDRRFEKTLLKVLINSYNEEGVFPTYARIDECASLFNKRNK